MDPTNNQQTPPRIIETAAATTSPDNAKSGPFAYLIALAALVACCLMGLGVGSCTQNLGSLVAEQMHGIDSDWYEEEGPAGIPDDWSGEGVGDSFSPNTQSYAVTEVLDAELSLYESVDSLLAASAYANAQPDVSSYVRGLVLTDRDATAELSELLHDASWGNTDLDYAFEQASEKAAFTIEALEAAELPQTSDSEISRALEQAHASVLDRWHAIQTELELLSNGEQVIGSEISDAEVATGNATAAAAEHCEEALSASRP